MKSSSSNLKAGAARVAITPPVGSALSGFVARTGRSAGVADDLHVRALILESSAVRLGVLQFDLLGLSSWHVEEIRHRAWKQCGILPWNLMLSATHTHSGPGVVAVRGCEAAELSYVWKVIDSALRALTAAEEDLKPAEGYISQVPYRLGVNRRLVDKNGKAALGVAPHLPAPQHLEVLTLQRSTGPAIYVFSHAAHPYILGAENVLISGDYPSFAASRIETSGIGATALFLNGCAGDIAPLGAFDGLDRARREGDRLAAAVLSAVKSGVRMDALPLHGDSLRVALDYAPLPAVTEIELLATERERTVRPEERSNPEVQLQIRAAYADWAYHLRRILAGIEPLDPVIAEVQALRIGDLTLIGISGEPFWQTGEKLKRLAQTSHAWSLGYCNAYSGYLPPAEAIPQGGYEVDDAHRYLGIWRLDAGSEQRLVEQCGKCLFGKGRAGAGTP